MREDTQCTHCDSTVSPGRPWPPPATANITPATRHTPRQASSAKATRPVEERRRVLSGPKHPEAEVSAQLGGQQAMILGVAGVQGPRGHMASSGAYWGQGPRACLAGSCCPFSWEMHLLQPRPPSDGPWTGGRPLSRVATEQSSPDFDPRHRGFPTRPLEGTGPIQPPQPPDAGPAMQQWVPQSAQPRRPADTARGPRTPHIRPGRGARLSLQLTWTGPPCWVQPCRSLGAAPDPCPSAQVVGTTVPRREGLGQA